MSVLPPDFDVNNQEHVLLLKQYLRDKLKGYYGISTPNNLGSYIYNSVTESFIKVPNSTFVKKADETKLYVTVDNNFHQVSVEVPLKITVSIKLTTSSLPTDELTVKIRDTIVQFVNSKQSEENIYFSELVTLLKSIPVVENVRIVEPKHDIIFNYDVYDLPLEDFVTYVPELIYTTEENVKILYE